MTDRFKGELKQIDPKKLISESRHDKTEDFFLVLGTVFNDLKGMVFFEKMLGDVYERPQNDEITSHAGNYGGTVIQIQKLMVGILNEFFKFLEKNADILNESEFKQVLNRLSSEDKQLWEGMVAASRGELPAVANLLSSIVKIRNNVAYHYAQSGQVLRSSYISRFFGKTKDARNEFAYYSIGDSLEDTRFYFADAAVEESLHISAGKKPGENSIGNVSLEKFNKQVMDTVKVMSITIASLLKNYIQLRRNQP